MTEPVMLTLAYILDFAIGDPKQLPHPVRVMGWAITKIENFMMRIIRSTEVRRENIEKVAGSMLVLIMVSSAYSTFYFINTMLLTFRLPIAIYYFSLLVLAYLVSTALATHELLKSARSVIKALKADRIEESRKNLSCIVGRDTAALDRDKILKATIESLAENTSDGIIAPLFYFAIGGLPLAMAYKAVNTLDSMVGYKNEKYKHFGWAAAKLDDIVNYLPARLTGLLIVISTFFIMIFKHPAHALRITHHALRIMLRDGRNHLSPNSGFPESAMAGALGIRLGGPSAYGGVIVEKPHIGDNLQLTINNEQLSESAISIVKVTSFLGLGLALILQYLRITIS